MPPPMYSVIFFLIKACISMKRTNLEVRRAWFGQFFTNLTWDFQETTTKFISAIYTLFSRNTPHRGGPVCGKNRDVDSLSLQTSWIQIVRGAPKRFPLANLGFCPNRLDPPPPPWRLGHPQPKKIFLCLFCILGYSKHFIFS